LFRIILMCHGFLFLDGGYRKSTLTLTHEIESDQLKKSCITGVVWSPRSLPD
jgi:hypothetical protein